MTPEELNAIKTRSGIGETSDWQTDRDLQCLIREIERLQSVIDSMAERVHAQSELLSRRAELSTMEL